MPHPAVIQRANTLINVRVAVLFFRKSFMGVLIYEKAEENPAEAHGGMRHADRAGSGGHTCDKWA